MRRTIGLMVFLVLCAAACGDDTAAPSAAGGDGDGPQRVVSISPTATEILFAIAAGDQVIAVDKLSTHPPEAPTTDLDGFSPSVESIAALDPDLVVLSFDPGDVVSGLDTLGIATVVQPTADSLDDMYDQFTQLGEVTGNVEGAAAAVLEIRAGLDAAVDAAPDANGVTYFHELDNTLFSITSATFTGEIYSLFGLENVADPADEDGGLGGYPQLSDEFLLDADPALIFLADTRCCGQSASTVGDRQGWDRLRAVANGNVIELDDDIASRWGPRVVEFAETISAALEAVADPT